MSANGTDAAATTTTTALPETNTTPEEGEEEIYEAKVADGQICMPANTTKVVGVAPFPINNNGTEGDVVVRRSMAETEECSNYCSEALGGAQATYFFNIYVSGSDLVCSCCPHCNTLRPAQTSVSYAAGAPSARDFIVSSTLYIPYTLSIIPCACHAFSHHRHAEIAVLCCVLAIHPFIHPFIPSLFLK